MKKILFIFLVLPLMLHMISSQGLAEESNKKLAQTGFQFLSVVSDAKGAAMAGAVHSLEMQSSSLFFNPAGMANQSQFIDVAVSDNKWIADIHHNTLSLSIAPQGGRYGVIGFSALSVDYGDKFYGTVVANNEKGFLDTGEISPTTFAMGVGYAKALSDRFCVGGQVRWIKQAFENLTFLIADSVETLSDTTSGEWNYKLFPYAFDFGTQFKTGIKSLAFGMSVRNFSREIKYVKEGFQLPLVFTLGISMDLMDLVEFDGPQQSLIMSVNATHFRSHPEQLIIGLDYKFMNFLSLRGGYVTGNDEDGLNYGFGITQFGLTLDYSYAPFGIFDNVQRFTARFAL